MANEFIARKGIISLGDSKITGSLNISQNLTVNGTLDATFNSSTGTAISGAFTSVSSSIASERLKNTTDTLTGDLTVTGTITAQEFHTEFVSASIIYQSGSTQFGDSADDTHVFTGTGSFDKVGIGTSSPDNGLHVKDTNIHLQASNAKIKLSDFDNSIYLRMNNTGSLEITDSNEVSLVHFNKNGKVGIGTNSPTELLHLYSVNNAGPEIRFQHPSGSHYIRAYDNSWNFLADASVQAISIQNNGTTTFGANVLIGNTVVNPATGFANQSGIGLKESSTVPKIEVSSDDTALSLNRTTTGGAGVIADLRYESNVRHSFGTATSYMLGTVGIGTTSPEDTIGYGRALDIQSSTGAAVYLRDSDNPTTQYGFLAYDGNDNGLKINNENSSGFIRFNTAGTERMRIYTGGTVEITHSTSPKLRLTRGAKQYTSRVDNANKFVIQEEGGNEFFVVESGASASSIRIDNTGNVGIGTTDPQTHLDVVSSTHTKLRVRTTGVADASMEVLGYDAGVHIGDATNGNRWAIWNDGVSTTSPLSFGSYALGTWYVPDSQVMTLTHDGKVGIGTTSPLALLHIKGTGDAIRVESTNTGAGGAQMDLIHYTTSPADEDTHGVINFGGYYSGTNQAYGSRIASIWTNAASRLGRLAFLTRNGADFNTAMTINHASDVGIGTTGPTYRLHVHGSGEGINLSGGNNRIYFSGYRAVEGSTDGAQLQIGEGYSRISLQGNYIGIGTTTAATPLEVHGQQKWYTTTPDGNELRAFFNPGGSSDNSNLSLYAADGSTSNIEINGGGTISMKGTYTNTGTGTGTYTRTTLYYDTSNGLLYEGGRTTDSSTGTGITWKFTWRGGAGTGGGVQLIHGNSSWTALTSDERLKTKTADITNGLDAINALSPIKYKWNNDIGSESEREITGFTAQNVQSAIPDAVFVSSQDEELGDVLTYQENYITAYLVKAVQELSAKNDQLQAEIDALKNA